MRENLINAFKRGVRLLQKPSNRAERVATTPALLPLTPEFSRDDHGVYFDILQDALEFDADVRNIAVTGSYGVGKSSILSQIARQHPDRVISVSMSTLGLVDDEALDDKGRTKPAQNRNTKTNRIQKEIVKQLLYSRDPVTMPGSRYRRITRFRIWRELGLAFLIAVPLTAAFLISGWSASLTIAIFGPEASPLTSLLAFVALTLLVLGFRFVFHNRIHIEKLGAGSATISLSNTSESFFDEYLDEIVYFFEAVKYDVVIFEDIDRFDDAHIFETLRSLNSILNGAKQLRDRRIRFIYAIKDSIFDQLGERAADEELTPDSDGLVATEIARREAMTDTRKEDAANTEVARANRTKFFDLVVPVVPFVTHQSARDLLTTELEKFPNEVSPDLVDLVARHIADMRLIKNIRNEFVVFKDRVIDPGSLNLDQTKLLAMILYKSTHLSDFELIKLGKSDLDNIYSHSRALIRDSLKNVNDAIAARRTEMRKIRPIAGREKRLGDALSAHIAQVMRYIGTGQTGLSLNGTSYTDAQLRSEAFWKGLSADVEPPLAVSYTLPTYGYSLNLSVSRADIATAVGDPLNDEKWVASERDRLNNEIEGLLRDREFLLAADMGDLVGRPDFVLEEKGEQRSFRELAESRLRSELAVDLVSAGYIDRYFTLYTSTFRGKRISANATNFILKNIDPNVVDMTFGLEPQDVRAIVRDRGESVLRNRAAFNVGILDYLLKSPSHQSDLLVDELVKAGDDQREFLLTYFAVGAEKEKLVTELAKRWPRLLTFLISEASLDDVTQVDLVNVALASLSDDIGVEVDPASSEFLRDRCEELKVFSTNETPSSTAASVARLLSRTNVRLPSLSSLGSAVLAEIRRVGAYEISRENLLTALGDTAHSLSLEAIAESNREIYDRVLIDLPRYLDALAKKEFSTVEPNSFISILEDVLTSDGENLQLVVAKSSPGLKVNDLTDISTGAWVALAAGSRFDLTLTNVRDYIEEFGVDDGLAAFLMSRAAIDVGAGDDEAVKIQVAEAILRAQELISSAEIRAQIVESLNLASHLPVSCVPSESGELVGRLLSAEVIADSSEAFTLIPADDIEGRIFAIAQSKEFVSYMSTTEVPVGQLGSVIESPIVPEAVKDDIVGRLAEFTASAGKPVLEMVARYAMNRGVEVAVTDLARLASAGVEAETVISLLLPHSTDISAAQLFEILTPLGEEYLKLTERNGRHARLPDNDVHRALVQRLGAPDIDIVSTSPVEEGQIRVHMKKA